MRNQSAIVRVIPYLPSLICHPLPGISYPSALAWQLVLVSLYPPPVPDVTLSLTLQNNLTPGRVWINLDTRVVVTSRCKSGFCGHPGLCGHGVHLSGAASVPAPIGLQSKGRSSDGVRKDVRALRRFSRPLLTRDGNKWSHAGLNRGPYGY